MGRKNCANKVFIKKNKAVVTEKQSLTGKRKYIATLQFSLSPQYAAVY